MADLTITQIKSLLPLTPEYNVAFTAMEGMREKSRLISTAPIRRWQLETYGLTNTEKDVILTHFNGQNGTCDPFNWIIPTPWPDDGTYYVRYEEFELVNPDNLANIWICSITFKERL